MNSVLPEEAPVESQQAFVASLIAVLLIGLGLYYGRQQRQSLRSLRTQEDLPAEDRQYIRNQARLRLVCCALMIVIAALVASAYLFGLEDRATKLGEQIAAGEPPNADQLLFRKLWWGFWMVILVLVLVIFFLAAADLVIIRRYGRKQMRRLQADRKAMVEEQVARLRSERNGHGHD